MGPKFLGSKKRKSGTEGGSSSQAPRAIPFNQNRFKSHVQEARYKKLEVRTWWPERIVRINPEGSYGWYYNTLEEYGWLKLCEPAPKFHLEIVREFYANVVPNEEFPVEGVAYEFKTWVRGKEINFSRQAIREFLGTPLPFEDGELCDYHVQLARGNFDWEHLREVLCMSGHSYDLNPSQQPQKFSRKVLTINAQVLMSVVLHNLRPRSHTSSLPAESAALVARMIEHEPIDITRIIANELKRVALSGTRHGDRAPCKLIFPGLIMNLCKKARVQIPSEGLMSIDTFIDNIFIERYCLSKLTVVPVVAARPTRRRSDPDREENLAFHMAHQRAFVFLHDFMSQLRLQMMEPNVAHPWSSRQDLVDYA